MAIDAKHEGLQSLRIDRSQRGDSGGEPPEWARRYILIGIAVVVLLGAVALAYRAFSSGLVCSSSRIGPTAVDIRSSCVNVATSARGRRCALGDRRGRIDRLQMNAALSGTGEEEIRHKREQ